MGLETGDFIDDLVDTNPLGTDPVSEGDDHLTLIKRAIVNAFKGDAATVTLLSNALDAALATTANGVRVGMPGVVGRVLLEDNNDVDAVTLDAAGGGVSLNALVEDVVLALNATPTGGGGVPLLTGDPNGEVSLTFAGLVALATTAFGYDATAAGANALSFNLHNGNGILATLLANDATFFQITSKRNGAGMQLRCFDTPGADRLMMTLDPDEGVSIFGQGSVVGWRVLSQNHVDFGNNETSWDTGSGSPEGVVTAFPGSIYSDQVSGSAAPLWMKNFGSGNTGWLQVAFV